jgi:hypothetical protein
MSIDEKDFVVHLLKKTGVQRIISRLDSSATVHPENEEYIEFELTMAECEELIGELSYEANHNRKKRISYQACEIAESLESQWYFAKRFNAIKSENK